MLCALVERYKRSTETCRLHFQGFNLKMLIIIYQTSRQKISDDSLIIYYHAQTNPLLLTLRLVIRKTDKLKNYKTKRLNKYHENELFRTS